MKTEKKRPGCRLPSILTLGLILSVTLSIQAQTYLIDFGGNNTTTFGADPDDPQRYWNNVQVSVGQSLTGVVSNLVSSLNITSAMHFRMVSRFNGANENGTTTSALYPMDATRDSLFGNTEDWSGSSSNFPAFKFTGLDAASQYSFTFFASRMGVSDIRETGFTVIGSSSNFVALDASNNTENTAKVSNLTPDAAGEISISMAPTENNNNANHFTYLGVLQVDVVPPQAPLSFTLQPQSQTVPQTRSVEFKAAVSGPGPYTVQWYENGVEIPGATLFTYNIASAELFMNNYTYSVSVSNLQYGVRSTNAVLKVSSDVTPPTLVRAVSYDEQSITLSFSETLDFSAYNAINYSVNGGTPGVISATLQPDGRTVVLGLDGPVPGAFTVVVNGVQDFVGNPIAPNSSISGRLIGVADQDVLFDFGGNNITTFGTDDLTNYWNNITTTVGSSDSGQQLEIITVNNVITPYSLWMIARFNGANENGTLASPLFPADATRDSLFGNTEGFSGQTNVFPKFKLVGLNPARKYNFTFFASRMSVTDNREAGYTLSGSNTNVVALNASTNVNRTVTAVGVIPDAAGEVTISIAPTANNNNGNHFTYLGVMRIAPHVAFLPPVLENGQIKLQWSGLAQLMRATSALGPWTPVQPAPSSPYAEPLVPGESRFYRLERIQ